MHNCIAFNQGSNLQINKFKREEGTKTDTACFSCKGYRDPNNSGNDPNGRIHVVNPYFDF